MIAEDKILPVSPNIDWHDHHLQQKINFWIEMRSAIMHEDNLVNHRFSWLLTFEGFLMAGFFPVQSAIAANKMSPEAIIGVEAFLVFILLASLLDLLYQWPNYFGGL